MFDLAGLHVSNLAGFRPSQRCGLGVVVVAGSSGAIPVERARLLADRGAVTCALRWFGGPGQPVTPVGVELEVFEAVIERLDAEVDRVAIVGASFGAEAALSVAARVSSVDVTVAVSPTRWVWPGVGVDGAPASHWTWRGAPLPFVPLATSWTPDQDPPAFRSWYEQSVASAPPEARIPTEEIAGEVVVIAGGDDQVWPSDTWAIDIEHDRRRAGLPTTTVLHPNAGHRPILPGEVVPVGGRRMRRGGTPDADRALGDDAWTAMTDALGLTTSPDRSTAP